MDEKKSMKRKSREISVIFYFFHSSFVKHETGACEGKTVLWAGTWIMFVFTITLLILLCYINTIHFFSTYKTLSFYSPIIYRTRYISYQRHVKKKLYLFLLFEINNFTVSVLCVFLGFFFRLFSTSISTNLSIFKYKF